MRVAIGEGVGEVERSSFGGAEVCAADPRRQLGAGVFVDAERCTCGGVEFGAVVTAVELGASELDELDETRVKVGVGDSCLEVEHRPEAVGPEGERFGRVGFGHWGREIPVVSKAGWSSWPRRPLRS